MTAGVHVRAPCRLHFGMFSFGQVDRPQFGGVGMMIDPPAIEITFRPAAQFAVRGALAERAAQFAASLACRWQLPAMPACELAVGSPPDHVGLGIGTQLGLAIAAGLREFLALPPMPIEELAVSADRGARSAVGSYGFRDGGLLVADGKLPRETLGTLAHRLEIPAHWRIVLVRPQDTRGLAGKRESDAFARLPPVPPSVTDRLWHIVHSEMLPAVERADCQAFGNAVYHFGRLAGECFASVQGGPFASPQLARLVDSLRAHGTRGVGQSSWGPTVFAVTSGAEEAREIVDWLHGSLDIAATSISVAQPNNTGAQLKTFS